MSAIDVAADREVAHGLADLTRGLRDACALSPHAAGIGPVIKAERSCTICAPTYTTLIGCRAREPGGVLRRL